MTTIREEIEKIIGEINAGDEIVGDMYLKYKCCASEITKATDAFLKLIADKLPKEMEPERCCAGGHTDTNCIDNVRSIAFCDGRNACLALIKKELGVK